VALDRDDALKKAEKFLRAGRADLATAEYQRLVDAYPNDWKLLNTVADGYVRANQPKQAIVLLTRIADQLVGDGFLSRAAAFFKRVIKLDPSEEHALAHLAEIARREGIFVEARQHLTALAVLYGARGDHGGVAEVAFRIGTLDPADLEACRHAAREAVAHGLADQAAGEWRRIVKTLEDRDEQTREVREEAIAHLPEAHALVQQWRPMVDDRAGVPLPESALPEVLSEPSSPELPPPEPSAPERSPAEPPPPVLVAGIEPVPSELQDVGGTGAGEPSSFPAVPGTVTLANNPPAPETLEQSGPAASGSFRLGPLAADLAAALGEVFGDTEIIDGGASPLNAPSEVDLSEALRGMKPTPPAGVAPHASQRGTTMPDRPEPPDLDGVFKDFRDEVSKQDAVSEAEQHYKLALTYRDMAMFDDAIRELEWAARAPRLRFEASSLLARLLRGRDRLAQSVEWYERAAEAPAPTPEAGRELLFELGQALEAAGEGARALAVYIELRADAGEYRDLSARIDRLTREQANS
jgi:tetratricopeptide (TPR) repeat protein